MLRESGRQHPSALTDLAELADQLPALLHSDPGRAAAILDRLAEECAEAAAMVRALPGRPRLGPETPGYTWTATAALTAAAGTEHDFAGWLAMILCGAAAYHGSSAHLVMGRSGSWEAEHVLALVRGTVGPGDEYLAHYREAGQQ